MQQFTVFTISHPLSGDFPYAAVVVKARYRIEVIDVLEHPALAREHGIVAVPMVVREAPLPIRKAVGDLSAAQRALFGLPI